MERRDFLKIACGAAAGVAAFAATAQAAPLAPHPLNEDAKLPGDAQAQPAVTSGEEAARLKPEEVRWHHHRHWGWRHRHWGWRHRHWGWRRRWHRRHWRRHWRRRYW
ncbi:twin-arginine translocation signal domain-containing protein [Bradyrhizobium sp. CCBAU 51753]|uniref:twin-arginine translocation signal domain-containing protein n=1 Tax=Bradyrhizobium sp. CCBAU 51753 TaxID=1325100 RepID=UPI00188AB5C4|nr:twin-arginine translocation signal domain-containing protein [Bradyrhizobium sp. CCBAU 51753]